MVSVIIPRVSSSYNCYVMQQDTSIGHVGLDQGNVNIGVFRCVGVCRCVGV